MKQAQTGLATLALLTTIATGSAAAQQGIDYEIAFPQANTHEARVTATFRGAQAGRPLELRMSRSSPGRYAVHEFAKNVYSVSATNSAGRPLAVTRPDPYGWSVTGHDGTVVFRYTVFGDRVDGTFLGIDGTHAHMNMPATFAWARGFEHVPIRLTVRPLPGWRVATQLEPTSEPDVFRALNLQYFLDSPTEVGPITVREWEQPYANARPRYRLAIHHLGSEAQVDSFVTLIRSVIAEQHAIWATTPGFDFGTYTFIADYLPWARGDGMEHRNSTILTFPGSIDSHSNRIARLGTVSHELFHAWNVERLRPRTLEPFDFERANMSDALWLAEGFTSYYGPLAIRRAGLFTDDDYAEQLGRTIITTIQSPARAYGSAVAMSQRAPFVDAATSIDPTHHYNIFLSYYTWGAAIGAALDLTLRGRHGRTLDDYMRLLWRDFGSAQTRALAPAKPYALANLRAKLAELTGDSAFADDFFRRFIEGSDVADYERLLGQAGFLLERDSVKPWLGASLDGDSTGVFINWTATNGSLYPAGIANGDVILSIDGHAVKTTTALAEIVSSKRPGDTVTLEVRQRAGVARLSVPLVGRAEMRVRTYESAARTLTPEMRAFRASWLGSKAAAGKS